MAELAGLRRARQEQRKAAGSVKLAVSEAEASGTLVVEAKAIGKAYGALAMGVGSKTLGVRAVERPHFISSVNSAIGGNLIPVAGGVLIRGTDGGVIGAVGTTGDTSDNDDLAARAGIKAAGLTDDPS